MHVCAQAKADQLNRVAEGVLEVVELAKLIKKPAVGSQRIQLLLVIRLDQLRRVEAVEEQHRIFEDGWRFLEEAWHT